MSESEVTMDQTETVNVHPDPSVPKCPECGTPQALRRKFNGGNPIEFWSPDNCDCMDDRHNRDADEWLERLAARRLRESAGLVASLPEPA